MSRALVARVRHDLGKYVTLEAAWVPDDAAPEVLAASLRQDLLATRRGPAGTSSAVEVWAELRAALGPLAEAPEARQIDAAMETVAAHLPALSAPVPDPEALRRLAASAEAVRRSCYAWWEGVSRS